MNMMFLKRCTKQAIMPSEGVDVHDITVGSICNTQSHGKPIPAEVIERGNFNK